MRQQPIAIIGLGCIFPSIQNYTEFWEFFREGRNVFSSPHTLLQKRMKAPPTDWLQAESIPRLNWEGGFIQDRLWKSSGSESLMDEELIKDMHFCKAEAWIISAARQALIGIESQETKSALAASGLVVSSMPVQEANGQIPLEERSLFNEDFCNQLGISFCQLIDAASASALYAIRIASEYLWSGDASVMLAGAVNAADPFLTHQSFQHAGVYAEESRLFIPLDKRSQGLKVSHGAGVVLLKLLSKAEQDKDFIYGVIRGQGWSNDGRGKHLLSPNSTGQVKAIRQAYKAAGISPHDVDYIECHASGTPKGDRVELASIEQSFKLEGAGLPPLGSVKGQLGHTLSAAGMASLMKIIASFEHKSWLPTYQIKEPLQSNGISAPVIDQLKPWTKASACAGINAFGFGGVNAHMILSSYPYEWVASDYQHEHKQSHGVKLASFRIDDSDLPLQDSSWNHIPPADLAQVPDTHKRMMRLAHKALTESGLQLNKEKKQAVGVIILGNLYPGKLLDKEREAMLSGSSVSSVGTYIEAPDTLAAHSGKLNNLIASRIANAFNFCGPAFVAQDSTQNLLSIIHMGYGWIRDNELEAVFIGTVEKNQSACLILRSEDFVGEDYGLDINIGTVSSLPSLQDSNRLFIPYAYDQNAYQTVSQFIRGMEALSNKRYPTEKEIWPNKILSPHQQDVLPQQPLPWIRSTSDTLREIVFKPEELSNPSIFLSVRGSKSSPQFLDSGSGSRDPFFIPISGTDQGELLRRMEKLWVDLDRTAEVSRVCAEYIQAYTASNYSIVFVGEDGDKLKKEILAGQSGIPRSFKLKKEWKTPAGSYFTPQPLGPEKVAFVYPGSASAYPYMGAGLFSRYPDLWPYLDQKVPDLQAVFPPKYIYPHALKDVSTVFEEFQRQAIPMITSGIVISSMYTYLLRQHFGIHPDMVFGYSMGETTTMWHALDRWSAEGVKTDFIQNPLFNQRIGGALGLLGEIWDESLAESRNLWKSYLLFAKLEVVRDLLEKYKGNRVYLSFINTPEEVVVSGDSRVCEPFLAELGARFIPLAIHNLAHHDFVRKEWAALIEMHTQEILDGQDFSFYSSISQSPLSLSATDIAVNSAEVCCQTVDFPGVVEAIYRDGGRVFIELGADASCTRWIQRILHNQPHVAVNVNKKGTSDQVALMKAMAILLSHGLEVSLDRFVPPSFRTPFPNPFFSSSSLNKTMDTISKDPSAQAYLLSEADIREFAVGDIVKSLGEAFLPFRARRYARQPNGELALMSRVKSITGERFAFDQKEKEIFSEYDVPVDAWYIREHAHPHLPYSVLMEIALQPCGMLAAYVGCILEFPDQDLFFRNLDGKASLERIPDLRGQTIFSHAIMKSCIFMGGTILLNFSFSLSDGTHTFFSGTTSFGFFPEKALVSQAGMDKEKPIPIWYREHKPTLLAIPLKSKAADKLFFQAAANYPHFYIKRGKLDLLAQVRILAAGGKYQNGYIYGQKTVDAKDWYFRCHFLGDPVMPGSLGVESIFQALKLFAIRQGLGKKMEDPVMMPMYPFQSEWKYRGQVLPHHTYMQIEVHIKEIQEQEEQIVIVAEGHLYSEETRIYELSQLALVIKSNPYKSSQI